jgi:hypothetical protein
VLDMVTFTNGPIFSARAQSTTLRGVQLSSHHQTQNPSSFKMSNDDRARAAAAQLVIDDEPDDWCVAVAEIRGRANELTRMAGTSGFSAQAVRVR